MCHHQTSILSGQFVQIRQPSCEDGNLVYFCARNGAVFTSWQFERPTVMSPIFFDGSSASLTVNVGSSMVTLALVSRTANSINVTATISYSDAVRLNGTWFVCEGTRLDIAVDLLSKYHFHNINLASI